MRVQASTHVGMIRSVNQDSFYVKPDGPYCIIADGMGGHKGGEVASQTAVTLLSGILDKHMPSSIEDVERMLTEAIGQVNDALYDMASRSEELTGMGTTLIVCYIFGNTAVAAHVGDSRLYHLTGGVINQITTDHSVVEQLVEQGEITAEEAKIHPHKNMITRAVGTEPIIESDIYRFSIYSGDCLLLCTDGVTNMVSDREIMEHISSGGQAAELVNMANNYGGKDNITAILIRV